MSKLKLIAALFLMAMGFMSYGQETSGKQSTTAETKSYCCCKPSQLVWDLQSKWRKIWQQYYALCFKGLDNCNERFNG